MKRRSQISNEDSNDLKPIYKEYSIGIYKTHISLYHYYFPFGGPKNIVISQISKISLENLTDDPVRWGISSHQLNHWFSLDPDRITKNCKGMNKFLSFQLKGKRIKPAITPNNIFQVFAILRANFTKQGNQMIQFQSNKDPSQTSQMQQQQNSQQIIKSIKLNQERIKEHKIGKQSETEENQSAEQNQK